MSRMVEFIVNQMGFRGYSIGQSIKILDGSPEALKKLRDAAKAGFVKEVVKEVPTKKKWNPNWEENKKSKDKE